MPQLRSLCLESHNLYYGQFYYWCHGAAKLLNSQSILENTQTRTSTWCRCADPSAASAADLNFHAVKAWFDIRRQRFEQGPVIHVYVQIGKHRPCRLQRLNPFQRLIQMRV